MNVLSSHVMLLTVRDLQLIGSKMNQLPAKFRTHDAGKEKGGFSEEKER